MSRPSHHESPAGRRSQRSSGLRRHSPSRASLGVSSRDPVNLPPPLSLSAPKSERQSPRARSPRRSRRRRAKLSSHHLLPSKQPSSERPKSRARRSPSRSRPYRRTPSFSERAS